MSIIDTIDCLLPQTQCQQCGFEDCRAYAKAIASGTPHNQCPPGGTKTILALSTQLKRDVIPLNPVNGIEKPKVVAKIQEDLCIGCTKCLDACPVDAIIGAHKKMHTVLADECTGCNLCVAPCPMDCIDLIELPDKQQPDALTKEQALRLENQYRTRHNNRKARLKKQASERAKAHKRAKVMAEVPEADSIRAKQRYIEAARARVQHKKAQKTHEYD